MTAFDPEPWHDLFVMTGGAAAALAGLIFVAVSINQEQILSIPALPSLAARALAGLVALVIVSALVLVPGQSVSVLGAEVLVVGVLLTLATLVATVLAVRRLEETRWKAGQVSITVASSLLFVVAGISLLAEAGGGLYWIVAQIVVGLCVASWNAWILLIEIRR